MLLISVLLLEDPVCHCQVKFGFSLSLPPLITSSHVLPQFCGSRRRYVLTGSFTLPFSFTRPPTPLMLEVFAQSVTPVPLARRSPSISNPPESPFGASPHPTSSVNCVQAVTVPWFAVNVNAKPTSSAWMTNWELEMFPAT